MLDAQARAEPLELRLDFAEPRLAPSDEVHLVHGRHDVADAEHGGDRGVPARLGGHA
jgi:hypothetical protein